MPSQKDSMLNLLANNYAVSATQKVIAQWNHNRYTPPMIYGYYGSTASNTTSSNYYSADKSIYAASITSNAPVYFASTTVSSSVNSSNIVRIMFDAMINDVSGISQNVSDFMLQVIPYTSGTASMSLADSFPITLNQLAYKKQEIFFCTNINLPAKFDALKFYFYPCNDVTTGSIGLRMKNICISPVSAVEAEEKQMDRLSIPFRPNRPGDQLVENLLATSSAMPISKYHIGMSTAFDYQTSSSVPKLLPTFLSAYNEPMFYISQPHTDYINYHNVFVEYPNSIKTNHIYIKTQNYYSNDNVHKKLVAVPNGWWYVFLKTSGSWATTPITASMRDDGSLVLQYNGSSWQNGYDDSTIPTLNPETGSFSAAIDLQGIKLVSSLLSTNQRKESRLRLIEISPRLTLDVSNFLISSSHEVNIDEGNYPVPVGLVSSNSGEVVLENLPRFSTSGSVWQPFSNNGLTPLSGLIKPDTKFTVYTRITDTSSGIYSSSVKESTMYAESWDENDIEKVTIQLNDYAKYLQSAPAPDLLLMNKYNKRSGGTLKDAIEALLQLGGFSDYDLNSLITVSDRLKKRGVRVPIFYCSRENKIWEILSQLLLGYQVSAFFDENGILQFRDILRETASGTFVSDSSSYFQITSSAVNGYLPNIISSDILKKTDVGEFTINYRVLGESTNLYDVNGRIFDARTPIDLPTNVRESNFSTLPWEADGNTALICANVIENVSASANKIKLGDFNHTDRLEPRFITGFNGTAVLEGEIISWDGLEYKFTPTAGFANTEIIKSTSELQDAVALRMGAIDRQTISTIQSATRGVLTITFSSNHNFPYGDSIYIDVYETINNSPVRLFAGKAIAYVTSPTTIMINDATMWTAFVNKYKTVTAVNPISSAYELTENFSYYPTGYICNVRRGLYGTSAAEHLSTNVYDANAFKGLCAVDSTTGPSYMQLGLTLEKKIEADNATNFPLALTQNKLTYLGFYQKDNENYLKYRTTFIPTNNLDSFGIFLGVPMTYSSGSVKFPSTSNNDFSNGIYIEFFPSNDNSSPFKATVRNSISNAYGSNIKYFSQDPVLLDTWQPTRWVRVPVMIRKNGKWEQDKDINGHLKWKKVKKVFPPTQTTVETIIINNKLSIKINGKTIRFHYFANGLTGGKNRKVVKEIPISGMSRNSKTFGVFSRTRSINSALNIKEIQAHAKGQNMDRVFSWEEVGNPSWTNFRTNTKDLNLDTILNSWTGINSKPSYTVRPFSLRAEPFLKGLEINEVKWGDDGKVPYFNLTSRTPSGLLGQQTVLPGTISTSNVIGTAFRGRVAYQNFANEVVYTHADASTYINAAVSGHSIKIGEDKKMTSIISDSPAATKIEINVPWSSGDGSIQSAMDDISKNLNSMNTVYKIEIFGNPALEVGDYVKLTYPEKNISDKKVIISSINKEFSGGGVSTNLTLRNANVNN